jgi:hypothetical protein
MWEKLEGVLSRRWLLYSAVFVLGVRGFCSITSASGNSHKNGCFVETAWFCFSNNFDGGFVLDDVIAIQLNPDVKGENPVADLFVHDFWYVALWCLFMCLINGSDSQGHAVRT